LATITDWPFAADAANDAQHASIRMVFGMTMLDEHICSSEGPLPVNDGMQLGFEYCRHANRALCNGRNWEALQTQLA